LAVSTAFNAKVGTVWLCGSSIHKNSSLFLSVCDSHGQNLLSSSPQLVFTAEMFAHKVCRFFAPISNLFLKFQRTRCIHY